MQSKRVRCVCCLNNLVQYIYIVFWLYCLGLILSCLASPMLPRPRPRSRENCLTHITDYNELLRVSFGLHECREQPSNRFLTIGKSPSWSPEEPCDLCETGSSSDPSVVCSGISDGTLLATAEPSDVCLWSPTWFRFATEYYTLVALSNA